MRSRRNLNGIKHSNVNITVGLWVVRAKPERGFYMGATKVVAFLMRWLFCVIAESAELGARS